jgi:DNA-binding transcriptional LysR family regulator
VGHWLVERHLGSYRLTALGEQLLPAAEGVEVAVTAFQRNLAARDKGLRGTVRVTWGSSMAACLLAARSLMLPGRCMPAVCLCGTVWSAARCGRLEPPSRHRLRWSNHLLSRCAMAALGGAPSTVAARSEHWQGVMLAVKAGAGVAAMPRWQGDSSELIRHRQYRTGNTLLPAHAPRHAAKPSGTGLRRLRGVRIKSFRALLSNGTLWALEISPSAKQRRPPWPNSRPP